jgi:hypothetical protein
MKRLLTLMTAALVVLTLMPAAPLASHSEGGDGDEDFVRGTGQVEAPLVDFAVHANARDTQATGHFFAKIEASPLVTGDFYGRVTCLDVVLNVARVGGVITKSTDPVAFPVGSGFIATIVDNGEPGRGVDTMNASRVPIPPTVCVTALPPAPITSGNYVVHDGQLP